MTDMTPMLIRTFAASLIVCVLCLAGARAEDESHVSGGTHISIDDKVAPIHVCDVDWPENFRPIDSDGWSIFLATLDTRILYVATGGDDVSAAVYEPDNRAVGPDPFNPAGDVKPFQDINTALKKQRSGMPDWILLKRGDTWRGPITEQDVPPGKSGDEPRLVCSLCASTLGPIIRSNPQAGPYDYCSFVSSVIRIWFHR